MESKITFFASFYETMKKLPDAKDRDRFAMGLLAYAFEGEEPDFTDSLALDLAFTNARPNLDAAAKRARAARENGERGGRPETKAKTKGKTEAKTDRETKQKTEAKTDQKTDALLEKDMDKEMDMDVDREAFLPLEEGKPSLGPNARAAAAARATPRTKARRHPRCPKCGRLLSDRSDGSGMLECLDHGLMTIGEAVWT